MAEHEVVNLVVNYQDYIILAISIFGGITGSFLLNRKIKKDDERDTIKNLKSALHQEFLQNIATIKDSPIESEKVEGEKNIGLERVKLKPSLLTYSFDSIVQSGKFTLLPLGLRNHLAPLYDLIHRANFYGRKIQEFGFFVTTEENKETFREVRKLQYENYNTTHKTIDTELKRLIGSLKTTKKE
jgi:hypothetical protein